MPHFGDPRWFGSLLYASFSAFAGSHPGETMPPVGGGPYGLCARRGLAWLPARSPCRLLGLRLLCSLACALAFARGLLLLNMTRAGVGCRSRMPIRLAPGVWRIIAQTSGRLRAGGPAPTPIGIVLPPAGPSFGGGEGGCRFGRRYGSYQDSRRPGHWRRVSPIVARHTASGYGTNGGTPHGRCCRDYRQPGSGQGFLGLSRRLGGSHGTVIIPGSAAHGGVALGAAAVPSTISATGLG